MSHVTHTDWATTHWVHFEDFKSLKSFFGPVLCDRTTIRNLMSSTTPFWRHKDGPSLEIVWAISGRRPFYKSCQTWPIEYYGTLRNFIRNLLSLTSPFGRHKDTPILDIVRTISGRRSFNKSCQTWSMEHCDQQSWGWVRSRAFIFRRYLPRCV